MGTGRKAKMQELEVFEAHASYVLNLLFTRDGGTLLSSGMDNVVLS